MTPRLPPDVEPLSHSEIPTMSLRKPRIFHAMEPDPQISHAIEPSEREAKEWERFRLALRPRVFLPHEWHDRPQRVEP